MTIAKGDPAQPAPRRAGALPNARRSHVPNDGSPEAAAVERARKGMLHEGRDLKLTTDFRSVLGEIISKHLGTADLNAVFPGFANDPRTFPNLFKA